MAVKNLFSALSVSLLALTLAGGTALAQSTTAPAVAPAAVQPTGTDKDTHTTKAKEGAKKDDKHKDADKAKTAEVKVAKVGEAAPAFTLKDTDGKEVSLAALTKAGKIVVLEWYNPECPYILKHHKEATTFNDLNKKYADKGVVFLAVNSNKAGTPGSGKEALNKSKADFKMAYQIVIDDGGAVAKSYGAKTTPHCFVIAKDGKLAYSGAIDNNADGTATTKVNYVGKALDELLANTSVSTPTTKPYGCAVKM